MAVGIVGARAGDRTEEDIRAIMRHPAHMAGSDGIFCGGQPHPRGWGAFARYLGRHTRELKDYDWGTAIVHLASHAARRFRLTDRGLIRPGFAADLAVFDPATIADRSTYEDGRTAADGVRHVLVNGTLVLSTASRPAPPPAGPSVGADLGPTPGPDGGSSCVPGRNPDIFLLLIGSGLAPILRHSLPDPPPFCDWRSRRKSMVSGERSAGEIDGDRPGRSMSRPHRRARQPCSPP